MKCGICGANVPYDLDRHKYTQHRDEWVAAKLRRRQNRDAKLKAQHEQVARRQQAIAALKKMTAMGYASEEWIKWSPVSLGSWLIPKFGEAVGWKEDLCFLTGKGASQPLGIQNAACKVQVAFETGQDASTFVLENSTAMFAKVCSFRSVFRRSWAIPRRRA